MAESENADVGRVPSPGAGGNATENAGLGNPAYNKAAPEPYHAACAAFIACGPTAMETFRIY